MNQSTSPENLSPLLTMPDSDSDPHRCLPLRLPPYRTPIDPQISRRMAFLFDNGPIDDVHDMTEFSNRGRHGRKRGEHHERLQSDGATVQVPPSYC
jgi:hypothetical protein